MKIDVKADVKAATKYLFSLKKQVPYATHKAINETLFQIRSEEIKAMSDDLDRPTPFTQKGMFVDMSKNKHQLSGSVYVPPIQSKYLKYQVEGGSRSPKNKAIPLGTHGSLINKYGNIKKGAVKKMLRDKKKYFSGVPKGRSGGQGGIYQRMGASKRKPSGHKIRMMIAWHPGAVSYKPRYGFYRIATVVVQKNFEKNVRKQVARAINMG